MAFQVTIKPSNRTFSAEEGEAVLEAAMRNGITLPYGCRNGACGSCKGKILEGKVDYGQYAAHILPEFEKNYGYALFCQAKPLTDLTIEAREINAAGEVQIKKLPCRVQRIERPSHDVAVLYLSLPANERLQFLAGHYLEIIMRDKTWNDELARKTYVAILTLMTKPAAAPKAEAAPKGTLEVAGKVDTTPADPVVDSYRRKLSMALF